jgi:hypothetical protein
MGEPWRDPLFESLSTEEQMLYFEWMETLQIQGKVSFDLTDEEYVSKMYRMLRCDTNYPNLDPDDVDFLDDL